jgi:hypothetical protein
VRSSRAEVIDREADAERGERVEHRGRPAVALHEDRLGQLEDEVTGFQLRLLECDPDASDDRIPAELLAREIDRDRHDRNSFALPLLLLQADGPKCPVAHRVDEPALLATPE